MTALCLPALASCAGSLDHFFELRTCLGQQSVWTLVFHSVACDTFTVWQYTKSHCAMHFAICLSACLSLHDAPLRQL